MLISVQSKCSEHAGQDAEFICTTCGSERVCAKCLLVGKHKGHSHISVEEYPLLIHKKYSLIS